MNMATHKWQDVVSLCVLKQFNIPDDEKVTVIDGKDFNPKFFGYK
jgi:hypothetical protein